MSSNIFLVKEIPKNCFIKMLFKILVIQSLLHVTKSNFKVNENMLTHFLITNIKDQDAEREYINPERGMWVAITNPKTFDGRYLEFHVEDDGLIGSNEELKINSVFENKHVLCFYVDKPIRIEKTLLENDKAKTKQFIISKDGKGSTKTFDFLSNYVNKVMKEYSSGDWNTNISNIGMIHFEKEMPYNILIAGYFMSQVELTMDPDRHFQNNPIYASSLPEGGFNDVLKVFIKNYVRCLAFKNTDYLTDPNFAESSSDDLSISDDESKLETIRKEFLKIEGNREQANVVVNIIWYFLYKAVYQFYFENSEFVRTLFKDPESRSLSYLFEMNLFKMDLSKIFNDDIFEELGPSPGDAMLQNPQDENSLIEGEDFINEMRSNLIDQYTVLLSNLNELIYKTFKFENPENVDFIEEVEEYYRFTSAMSQIRDSFGQIVFKRIGMNILTTIERNGVPNLAVAGITDFKDAKHIDKLRKMLYAVGDCDLDGFIASVLVNKGIDLFVSDSGRRLLV